MTLQRGNKTRKLGLEQVQEMRRLYGEGVTQGALARHFGMSVGQVGRIVRGESWQEGAGNRMPTQAEQDATLKRLLDLQERVNTQKELGTFEPPERKPPPSLLDGGDAESEVDGSGLSEVQKRAAAYGIDMDKLLEGK